MSPPEPAAAPDRAVGGAVAAAPVAPPADPPPAWLVPLCLFLLYTVWGSTYYAIRVLLETTPPFGVASLRFVLAGTLLAAWARGRGEAWPTLPQLRSTAIVGFFLFVLGNGLVMFAEQHVGSGLTAILVATVTLWTTLIEWAYGRPPSRVQVAGVVLGLSGVVLLNAGGELSGSGVAVFALMVSACGWGFGTVQGRRLPMPGPVMTSAFEMAFGGVYLALLSLGLGERLHGPITGEAVGAFLWLLVGGSLVGFSAFATLVRIAPLPVATSYAYVNPVVALIIGAWLGGEPWSAWTVAGLAVILVAVGLVLAGARRRAGAP